MNVKQYKLVRKNIEHWAKYAAKLDALPDRTEAQEDDLERRGAQLTVWAYELKNSQIDPSELDDPNDMSASSGLVSTEHAGGEAKKAAGAEKGGH